MRTTIDHSAGRLTLNRGWSHSALQQARIGLDPWGVYWATDDAAGWTLLPIPSFASPDHPWTAYVPRPEHLADLGARAGLDGQEAWHALLEHDEAHEQLLALTLLPTLAYNDAVKDALHEAAAQTIRDCRRELGDYLRACLSARVDLNPVLGQVHGHGELGYVHVTARLRATHDLPGDLQPRNDDWLRILDDLGDRDKLLRVCELSGVVFRGRQTATKHPAHRGRKLPTIKPGLVSGLLDASLGTCFRASDPLERYAVAPRYRIRCEVCATTFTTSRLGVSYCKRCGSVGRRVRRVRGDATDSFVRPKPLPVDRRTHVLLIDNDEFFFESVEAAQKWVAQNVGPTHNGRLTIQTIEGYNLQRAWERDAA